MWNMQQPSGLINAGHPDGNFARTTLMVALWKTRGLWTDAWRPTCESAPPKPAPAWWRSFPPTPRGTAN